ncbi:MAG: radical SAM protein [Pseudomonadota bacterium]
MKKINSYGDPEISEKQLQKAFVKPFKTIDKFYLYDVGTNRIFNVDEVLYTIIPSVGTVSTAEIVSRFKERFGENAVKTALDEIETAQKDGVFIHGYPSSISLGLDRGALREKMSHELGQMLLEISQDCNLNCHYCTFSGCYDGHRIHNPALMSSATMKKAVDFLFSRSDSRHEVTCTLYGGEPLLNFTLIKELVTYCGSLFKERSCRFSMTTNGTLMTEERAQFFCKHGFEVTVSLDGPSQVHDAHRVDRKGEGSYRKAIRGLKFLVDAYKDKPGSRLAINMVITPPHTLAEINRLWEMEPWLPPDSVVMASYVDAQGTTFTQDHPVLEVQRVSARRINTIFARDFFLESILKNNPKQPLGQALYEKSLAKIKKRPVFSAPAETCHLNGCCLPGVRKVFVDPDGQLKICERVHQTPYIGNINDGYDFPVVLNLIESYEKGCREKCLSCWAVRFCGLCFAHAFKTGQYNDESKETHCESERDSIEANLELFYYLLEKDPQCLNFLEDYTFE